MIIYGYICDCCKRCTEYKPVICAMCDGNEFTHDYYIIEEQINPDEHEE